ncbi:3-oxoacyl-[acyl-carrier-protein] reductase FabG [bioreactor metagenome]|uniref:3-oxoacyl-[acyl-carrier-protein] reductase FabG n=1 Tax=bioreactor metagenome TaxID=1076179 RepID=A0A645C4A1_9ZZZZ
MSFNGKVAIVTGSGGGIGKAIAIELYKMGTNVILFDLNESALKDVKKELESINIKNNGNSVKIYSIDITNSEKVKTVIKEIADRFNKIDILVNSAGVISSFPLLKLEENEWDRIININLKGTFLVTKYVVSEMIEKMNGKIVNIGSDLSYSGQKLLSHYVTSKHGVLGFTRSIALECAEYGILVNAVCPGPTETSLHHKDVDMQIGYTGISKQEHLRKELEHIPLKKLGKPIEVAKAVLFLVSDDNTHITGASLTVNGGIVMN